MSDPLIVKDSVIINAPAAKVWDALINPGQTKKYMFGCETVSDWKVGSSLLWKGNYEGKEMIFVKGTIADIKPEKYLEYTVIDPNGDLEDIPENYLTVTYTLENKNGQTLLIATQGDYSKVGDGERRYNHMMEGGGWGSVLKEIKKLVESE